MVIETQLENLATLLELPMSLVILIMWYQLSDVRGRLGKLEKKILGEPKGKDAQDIIDEVIQEELKEKARV